MTFQDCMRLVPDDCNTNTRNFVKRKIEELENELQKLKIKSGISKINLSMFKENRNRLVSVLKKKFPNSMVLLKGDDLRVSPNCTKVCFQQDSNFYWAFGLEKPNLWGAIDVPTGTSYIFYDSQVERNKISSRHPEKFKKYNIDKVVSSADMKYEICKLGRSPFLVVSGLSELKFTTMLHEGVVKVMANCGLWVCNSVLSPDLKTCRRVKSKNEQALMAVTAKLNSEGIIFVIQNMRPGMAGYGTSALFDLYIYANQRHATKARPVSCLSGSQIFCLDHARSTFFLKEDLRSGDLCMLNMGVALRNYRTNVIVTIPVNGIFSDRQRVIYNIVLEIRSAMLQSLKPGITFGQLNNVAHNALVKQIIQNFLLEGTVNNILESGICDLLTPNGIGHFMGIDFYDSEETGNRRLSIHVRENINDLVAKEGMVLALNSEMYLNEVLIKKWMISPLGSHLETRYLPDYLGLAARIQDVVLVKARSIQLLSDVPITISEIEKTMAEKVEIPFRQFRSDANIAKGKSAIEMSSEKLPNIQKTILVDKYPGKALMKLRFQRENEERTNLDMILKKIKESRECKPMRYVNQIMEEVYSYPFKKRNMLEMVMIPLIPSRRRPSFLPYPEVSPIAQTKVKFPKSGYGCPYFNWHESFESCWNIIESCLTKPNQIHQSRKH